jgi:hypothetical protein
MSFTQLQIDAFWWGNEGSASNILPGAYATMNGDTVIYLTSPNSPGYDAGFAAILSYLYLQALNKTGVGPTGADGFYSQNKIGALPISARSGGTGWLGPTKS